MSHSLTMNDMNSTPEYQTTNAFEVGTYATTNELQQHAPEWIELLPAGEFVGRDGRGPFRVSNAEVVIAATDALRMEAGLPIDYDHATDFAAPSGRRAPAAGWIRAIEVREGALWGKVEWTTHGSAAVATHEYRYISPVFEYSQNGEVQRILRAALTNNPNLYLTAISAHGPSDKSMTTRVPMRQMSAARASEDQRDDMGESTEAQLCELLGLEKGSTPEMIIGEVQKALGTNTRRSAATEISEEAGGLHATAQSIVADPARYVPIEQFETALTELNQLRVATARERAAFRVDAAMKAGKIVPSQREWAIAYCQANTNGFESFIARQPALITGVTEGFEGAPTGVRTGENTRDNEGMESRRAGASLTRTELAVCAKLGLRPHEYIRRRGLHDELTTLP
jgi:phage I-like protein